jgi:hypothetical protein
MSTASNPSTAEKYSPGCPMYLHAATAGAGQAINEWLRRIERCPMYLFEVSGVECALEFFTSQWPGAVPYGMVEGGRWRWGRLESGDPDEDESGEDILLDVALSRPRVRGRQGRRYRANFPPYADGGLSQAEIEAYAVIRAVENLGKLSLRKMI